MSDAMTPQECRATPAPAEVGESLAWIGCILGAYRLTEKVGQGGMGTVYRAIRADGLYQRPVAVKLIRASVNREYFLRRFEQERHFELQRR
jgi:eukaryotic-like serine/threonine-protein kinase